MDSVVLEQRKVRASCDKVCVGRESQNCRPDPSLSLRRLKQKTSGQQDADDYEDCDDDDFNQAHDRLTSGKTFLTGGILIVVPERVNHFICKEL